MTDSRLNRQVLLSLIVLLMTNIGFAQQFPNPLFIPDTLMGPTYNLEVRQSKVAFLPGDSTATYGINYDYLGPTLIMNADDTVQLNVTNSLIAANETTTMHWHGMHVAPEHDGGPHTPILVNETWSPRFRVIEEATTFWYHPHLHHFTAKHVYSGAAGMIIVRDSRPVGDLLPHTYGVDEFPLIIQDKSFDTTNQLIYTALADTMMVNGTLGAHLEVPAQMVRFHILNASNQRVYNLGLPPNLDAWQTGSDGGFLENRLPLNRIQLTPGERIELVVDFSTMAGPSPMARMVSFGSELGVGLSGGPQGPKGGAGNKLDSIDFEFLEFRVVAPTPNAITSIPVKLNTYNKPLEANADRYRKKVFTVDSSGFPFYINGLLMDKTVFNDTVELGDIEVWTLINATEEAHPWHIHDVQFYILDINGNPPPPQLAGRKDVIITQPGDSIRYIAIFEDFANDTIPYMFHCHNLFHEDGGMMGQFIVRNTTGISEIADANQSDFLIYPNPAKEVVYIERKSTSLDDIKSIELHDLQGKLKAADYQINNEKIELKLTDLPTGTYIIKITANDGSSESLKLSKH